MLAMLPTSLVDRGPIAGRQDDCVVVHLLLAPSFQQWARLLISRAALAPATTVAWKPCAIGIPGDEVSVRVHVSSCGDESVDYT
jgi:hypothetical protein